MTGICRSPAITIEYLFGVVFFVVVANGTVLCHSWWPQPVFVFLCTGVYGWGGEAGAGRLSSFMHLSGRSRAIKFLYAPERPEQGDYVPFCTCSPIPPETSLVGSCT